MNINKKLRSSKEKQKNNVQVILSFLSQTMPFKMEDLVCQWQLCVFAVRASFVNYTHGFVISARFC